MHDKHKANVFYNWDQAKLLGIFHVTDIIPVANSRSIAAMCFNIQSFTA